MGPAYHLGFASFLNSLGLLAGKDSESQRILCACFLARQMVWHLFVDPASRHVLHVAEEVAREKPGKAQLREANKIARRWNAVSQDWTSASESTREAMSIAYAVTCPEPFGKAAVESVGERIAGSLMHAHLASHADSDWETVQETVQGKAYSKMSNLVREFVGDEPVPAQQLRSLRDDPELRKYLVENAPYLDPGVMRDWVRTNLADKSRMEELLEAIDCFFDVAPRSAFLAPDVEPIHRMGSSAHRVQREIGVQLLLVLGMHHDAARVVLLELLNSRKVAVRFTAIAFFEAYHVAWPPDFILRVIGKAIEDVSAKVRIIAAQAAWTFRAVGVGPEPRSSIPMIIDRLKREKNEEVVRNLLATILTLDPTHELRETADGTVRLFKKQEKTGGNDSMLCEIVASRDTLDWLGSFPPHAKCIHRHDLNRDPA
jgi:hypothetical protein